MKNTILDSTKQFQNFHYLIPTKELLRKRLIRKMMLNPNSFSSDIATNFQFTIVRNLIIKYIKKINDDYDTIKDFNYILDIDISIDDENNILIHV